MKWFSKLTTEGKISTVHTLYTEPSPKIFPLLPHHVLYFSVVPTIVPDNIHALLLGSCFSCPPACWPAWPSWRSAWLWTEKSRSYWLFLQCRCPYRSSRPPACGERRCVQRRTRGRLQPVRHRGLDRSSRPGGVEERCVIIIWMLKE